MHQFFDDEQKKYNLKLSQHIQIMHTHIHRIWDRLYVFISFETASSTHHQTPPSPSRINGHHEHILIYCIRERERIEIVWKCFSGIFYLHFMLNKEVSNSPNLYPNY